MVRVVVGIEIASVIIVIVTALCLSGLVCVVARWVWIFDMYIKGKNIINKKRGSKYQILLIYIQ